MRIYRAFGISISDSAASLARSEATAQLADPRPPGALAAPAVPVAVAVPAVECMRVHCLGHLAQVQVKAVELRPELRFQENDVVVVS